ncbi:MAG: FKBP-type peptidyl-prolyl cis-trans isomerase [Bacteroidales bacterium]|nr:FKBP-type peptidyl-prolyl cis-trans isomerase [Bacteroidales bacterium]
MKRFFLITMALCALAVCSTSCKDKKLKGFEKTDNELYYKFIVQNKDARAAENGDYLFLTVSYRTDNDSIVFEERDVVDMMQESVYPGDLYEAYSLMHEGDEASFALKADTFFLHMGIPELPDFITEETMVFFTIKMNRIRSAEEVNAEKQEEIKQYMSVHGLEAEPRESGLYFIETQVGKGTPIANGDSLSIRYTFKLANDSVFDSSEGKDPLYCIVGRMFAGLDEGLSLMKRGGKATLIMPYHIAFGVQNPYIPVPPFSTIIAEIEVLPNIVRPQNMMQQ